MNAKTFIYPVTIREVYLDSFGHMNNAMYATLFEEARWEFITANGYGINKIKESGLGPTVLEMKIRFIKELVCRDEVIIETKLISYERKIGKLSQKMIRNGEVCTESEYTVGLFDIKARKLVLPTPEWLFAIGYL